MKAKSHSLKAGILEGIRVLDLSRMLSGPYATMLLADHGAEVIKIENADGDSSRRSGPFKEYDLKRNWSGYFISLNRNKKSISLNLKKKDDVDFLKKLIEGVDVLVENFRPGVMERLGLDPEICLDRNEKIVYGRMTGWGQSGPMAHAAGHDINYIALAGALHAIGRKGEKPVLAFSGGARVPGEDTLTVPRRLWV